MILLEDRALIDITGDGASAFLQNLITTDMPRVAEGSAHAGALLTPQGKIQFEFLVSGIENGIRLETGQDQSAALLKRLTMYRLRLPLALTLRDDLKTYAAQDNLEAALADQRFGGALFRLYTQETGEAEANRDWLDAAMIAHGVASAGVDYDLSDAFPHDINLDQIGGMSFAKGCYVGQEVISRMHHKSDVRKRLVIVQSTDGFALPDERLPLTVEGRSIGTLGRVLGHQGLAICRIDKAAGADVLLGAQAVALSVPKGAHFALPTAKAGD